jgi:amino acid adenylation domain-containing protein
MSDQLRHIAGLSPEKQALLMRRLQREGDAARRPQIRPRGRTADSFPLSFAQQRLWFLNQLQPDSPFYNVPDTYRLTGRLDARVLERCFDALVRRHETLRTTFKLVGGEPRQFIQDPAPFTLQVVDLTHLPAEKREAEALRLAEEEATRLFDLTRDPMLRARLVRLGEDEHFLLMSMHHIASDGWSRSILADELMKLYEAYSEGREPALEPLPIQYADYAMWQREYLSGEVLSEQLGYWKEQLGGELPALGLPTDHPRPPMLTYSGAYYPLEFPQELGAALSALGRKSGATRYMVLLAAFDALLYRYTGQEDVVVGTPIAGRNRREVEGLIGFFVNTLVMRASLSGEPTFRKLLGRVREVTLGAYGHQEVPFEKLVEELHPERDMSRNPLFQVAFALQNAPTHDLALRGLNMTPLEIGSDASRFDLEVHIWEEEDEGLGGYIVYSTDLFVEASMARLHAHYVRLLEGVAADPDARIAELSLLAEAETRQLLYEWNDTRREYPHGQCVHELFEAQAARTPGAVALVCGEQRVTYAELNRRADGLARRLQAAGVGPEVAVGLYAGRTVEMVVGLLAVLKAGGAYVPLDPDYPHERLAFILADTQAGVLLTEKRLLDRMPPHEAEVIRLDDERPACESAAQAANRAVDANLAYFIYTSGSTGRPKGVAITHRSVVTLLHWARENFSARELEGVLAATSICFDLSAFELFVPLSVGGKVILAENALALPTLPAAGEVTLINTVPSAMAELVRMSAVPRSVLCVNLAGEPLKNSLAQQVYAQPGVRRVLNLYGPSEDTTYSTAAAHARGATTEPTIGRPIANTQVYVLDGRLEPVAVGVRGELYLGGAGLARGYLARPDLTAERFIPDPFGGMPGGRLYRTGDVARYLSGGELEFLGRADQQVKIRGFRIEPGEIEAVLSTHPAVRQAIVTAGEDATGEGRLIAYVAGAKTGASTGELKAFLRERLPPYMMPSVFVFLDALPLTPSGKVDRQRLPVPDGARPSDAAAEYVAPRTPGEEALAAIWREVLGVEQVGVYDNFFSLGGHSLLATRAVSLVRERCGAEVPLRLMFESPTVEGIAAHVEVGGQRQEELGRLTDVLDRLEQLTEEEVRALLEGTTGEINI